MPEGVANSDFGLKTVGSRTPLHDDHNLCRLEQGSEQVLREQRGQVYLGALMWQMLHSDESRGSAMLSEMNVVTFPSEAGFWASNNLSMFRKMRLPFNERFEILSLYGGVDYRDILRPADS